MALSPGTSPVVISRTVIIEKKFRNSHSFILGLASVRGSEVESGVLQA